MNIKEIHEVNCEIIETDASEFPTYRRSEGGTWENLMGESWESVYSDELELMYENFKKNIIYL